MIIDDININLDKLREEDNILVICINECTIWLSDHDVNKRNWMSVFKEREGYLEEHEQMVIQINKLKEELNNQKIKQ